MKERLLSRESYFNEDKKMKRYLLFVVLGVVALCVSAQDRFYIEDFSITPGETSTISILLDNEAAYTAFQIDITMPNGLTVEQEDGDYIFDLTSRKARDHNIGSQLQPDGTIRVISYSPGVKPYSGNSGALVTFDVTASEDFTGPAVIAMRNILFTTEAGVEIPFGDEVCTVTRRFKGDVNDDGIVDINDVTALIDYLLGLQVEHINVANADVDDDDAITINDVTALIDMLLSGIS